VTYAYTPGLKIKKLTKVYKRRVLAMPGEVLVQKDEFLSHNDVVARTYIAGDINMVPVAYIVGVRPHELPKVMLKKEGESVKEGEIIAVSTGLLRYFRKEYRSKMSGKIEFISSVTGMVAIRSEPVPIQIDAYISGRVIEIVPMLGAIVETPASFVQGILGIGGETHGELMTIAPPDEALMTSQIGESCSGKIVTGGALATYEVLMKAASNGVRGIIVGGIKGRDLYRFLGYEMGVAITGHENIPMTCIITEGFGRMSMAKHTFKLLDSLEGKLASIDGTTQIRAGVIRPEIVVPLMDMDISESKGDEDLANGMDLGLRVRIIREPYLGAIGSIVNLPQDLQELETESKVRVLVVQIEDGRRVTVPRANVEVMEE